MLADLLILVFTVVLQTLVFLLPTWTVWPPDLLTGLTYFLHNAMDLNIIIPGLVADFFVVLLFAVRGEAIYFTARGVIKLFNFLFRRTLEI